jgi:hypothetical protein
VTAPGTLNPGRIRQTGGAPAGRRRPELTTQATSFLPLHQRTLRPALAEFLVPSDEEWIDESDLHFEPKSEDLVESRSGSRVLYHACTPARTRWRSCTPRARRWARPGGGDVRLLLRRLRCKADSFRRISVRRRRIITACSYLASAVSGPFCLGTHQPTIEPAVAMSARKWDSSYEKGRLTLP